jgi:hypothetical protein
MVFLAAPRRRKDTLGTRPAIFDDFFKNYCSVT